MRLQPSSQMEQSIRRLDSGWNVHFPGGSLKWLLEEATVPRSLLIGGLSFSPHGLLYRAPWVSSQHGGWLPQEQTRQERARQNDLALGKAYHPFCCTLLVTPTNSNTVVEGVMQGHEHQEVGDYWGSSWNQVTADGQRGGDWIGVRWRCIVC